ncbi:hypothetical protein [uncultured Thiodictyon sp.]|nr:hypothetical protein [uncultured Thiodictyon sp.]
MVEKIIADHQPLKVTAGAGTDVMVINAAGNGLSTSSYIFR